MSLIPSESASFSDLLGRGLGASRKSKWRQPEPPAEAPPPPLKKTPPVPAVPEAVEDHANTSPVAPSEPAAAAPVEVEKLEKAPALPEEPAAVSLAEVEELEKAPAPTEEPAALAPAEVEKLEKAPPPPEEPAAIAPAEVEELEKAPPPPEEPAAIAPAEVEQLEKAPTPPEEPAEKPDPVSEKPAQEDPAPPPSPPRPIIPALVMTKPVSTEPSRASSESERTYAPIPIVRIARSAADRQAVKSDAPAVGPAVSDSTADSSVPTILGPATSATVPTPRLRPRPVLHPRPEPARVREPEAYLQRDEFAAPRQLRPAVEEENKNTAPPSVISADPPHFLPRINTDVPEEFEFPEPASVEPTVQGNRRARLFRFIALELFVVLILAGAVFVGLDHRLSNTSIAFAAKVVAIIAAIAAAVVPILFYGIPETPPRDRD